MMANKVATTNQFGFVDTLPFFIKYQIASKFDIWITFIITVKAPYIAHLSLLTPVGYKAKCK